MKYKLKYWWQDVCAYFNPRQKWLTKVVPNTWCDKTELIPRLLFASLVHFVEEEEGIAHLDTDWTDELEFVSEEYVAKVKSICGELKEAYDYIKVERPGLQKALDKSYPDINLDAVGEMLTAVTVEPYHDYHATYAETNRIEKLIEDKDQWAMNTITKHVGFLWT